MKMFVVVSETVRIMIWFAETGFNNCRCFNAIHFLIFSISIQDQIKVCCAVFIPQHSIPSVVFPLHICHLYWDMYYPWSFCAVPFQFRFFLLLPILHSISKSILSIQSIPFHNSIDRALNYSGLVGRYN